MVLAAGELVDDRYRVLQPLGHGGMGCVYLAENVRIGRRVALKVLHPHLAFMEDIVARFEREARAAAAIGSPHVADVLDLGFLPSGERYVVMEHLVGESLGVRLHKRGRLTTQEVAAIATQLLEGLAEVHSAGIVHRDLKPANIFLVAAKGGDFVKILDFGISKFRAGLLVGPEAFTVHEVVGTPAYMSPEHVRGDTVDARTDIYSVGAVLYRCVTGRQPFSSDNHLDLLLRIERDEPRPIEAIVPDVDPTFARIVRRAMSKDPSRRHQSAAQLRDAIDESFRQIDRLLAEFLEVPLPPVRPRVVSKIVIDPDERG